LLPCRWRSPGGPTAGTSGCRPAWASWPPWPVSGGSTSAWIYWVDSSSEVLRGTLLPDSFTYTAPNGYTINLATNLYLVVRDTVVVIEHLVAFAVTFWAALKIQDMLADKQLAPGEVRPEAGGYH